MAAWRARGAGTWLLLAAAASALYALIINWTGGFDLDLGPLTLRSHAAVRPAVLSVIALLLYVTLDPRGARGSLAVVWQALNSRRTSVAVAACALPWTLAAGVIYGSLSAGGADSFGYVSQALLMKGGRLTEPVFIEPSPGWSNAAETLTPLGYVLTPNRSAMAPTYPPGLPMLMAVASVVGDRGIYLVVPFFGVLLVGCVWLAGARLGSPLAAAAATVLVSASPTFLVQLVQPMSDVPAAALWLAAVLAAGSGRGLSAGFLSGLAILARPNLAPLAIITGGLLLAAQPSRLRRLAAFAGPLAVSVATLMWIQSVRFGSPFGSGYGRPDELFGLQHVPVNAQQYGVWVTSAHTPVVWLALAAPFVLGPGGRRPLALALAAIVLAVWAAYLPYVAFQPEEWQYTRFLLPAIAVMLLFASLVVVRLAEFLPVSARPLLVVAVFGAAVWTMSQYAGARGISAIRDIERRYPRAAQATAEHATASTYVLASQHSGSIRLYAGLRTVRWDLVQPGEIELVVARLRALGGPPLLVLDSDELDAFRARFEGSRVLAAMRPVADLGRVGIYRLE